ncbi:ATP-dependent DNA helicase RecQ [Desemzia sp. RIT804]|uniref:RecQ family ATP-dependent DNA helicase n=1 Tax=Desemzia sp. RIT 804 TaxID=2810209 RepID=UPI00194EC3C8|nr:ATP-dependent DNA helicase RecQ [Desemzia sp. RIT 804]MBM6613718.1 ATP-dependent DNA helicase RecQ [Desemzia sp. RIT 804]
MKEKTDIHQLLAAKFGFHSFREGQEEAIQAALSGQDTLVMLPTGTGKSICYQLTGYALGGTTIIVSPLISLMQDQVEQLKMNSEKRVVALNSMLPSKYKRRVLSQLNQYKFIYLSPEMLHQPMVLDALKKVQLSLFVVDEAHCISQWGMDFRPEYSTLGAVREVLGNPLTMALTATATPRVREEIVASLRLDRSHTQQVLYSVNRSNIAFGTILCENNKNELIIEQLQKLQKPGIIYFSSKKMADEIAMVIRSKTDLTVESYHSSLETEDKIKIQHQFIQGEIDIICATSAFGMGINKNNIRFVFHYHLPASPEAYLQEVGRAGRDGEPSIALLFYERGDHFIHQRFQEEALPSDDVIEMVYRDPSKLDLIHKEDVHKQLLSSFLETHQPIHEVKQKIALQRQVKENQLYFMLQYIQTSACKREMLLHYFEETVQDKPEQCCSSCGIDLKKYELSYENKGNSHKEFKREWENRLNDLFLLKNL